MKINEIFENNDRDVVEDVHAASKVARQMGELNVYVGDDGMIYTQ